MCLRLGIDDPIEWLENVSDEVFDLWYAYYRLEPWGNEAEMMAEVATNTQFAAVLQSTDAKATMKAIDNAFKSRMPAAWINQPETTVDSIEAAEQIFAKAFG